MRARTVLAFLAGVAILYHEIVLVETAEPLLVFLGLWLCGVPPAIFFDGVRRLGESAQSSLSEALEGDTSGVPKPQSNGDMPEGKDGG